MRRAGGPWPGRPAGDLERTVARVVGSPREARWLVEEAARVRRTGRGLRAAARAAWPSAAWPGSRCSTCSATGRSASWTSWSTRRALIPRPETEWVVDVALLELDRVARRRARRRWWSTSAPAPGRHRPVDRHRAGRSRASPVVATDRDPDVLELARANARRLAAPTGAPRGVAFREGSWWGALEPSRSGARSRSWSRTPPTWPPSSGRAWIRVVRDHEPYRCPRGRARFRRHAGLRRRGGRCRRVPRRGWPARVRW